MHYIKAKTMYAAADRYVYLNNLLIFYNSIVKNGKRIDDNSMYNVIYNISMFKTYLFRKLNGHVAVTKQNISICERKIRLMIETDFTREQFFFIMINNRRIENIATPLENDYLNNVEKRIFIDSTNNFGSLFNKYMEIKQHCDLLWRELAYIKSALLSVKRISKHESDDKKSGQCVDDDE